MFFWSEDVRFQAPPQHSHLFSVDALVVNTGVRQANVGYKQTHHHEIQSLVARHNHGTA